MKGQPYGKAWRMLRELGLALNVWKAGCGEDHGRRGSGDPTGVQNHPMEPARGPQGKETGVLATGRGERGGFHGLQLHVPAGAEYPQEGRETTSWAALGVIVRSRLLSRTNTWSVGSEDLH